MVVCTRCGTENPEGFRFCGNCTAPLQEMPAPRQARKVVTALFADVTGSTALGEELDPEVLRGVMNRYFREIRSTIERHGGTVDKFIGDAVMAVFGIPRVREDDALRAVRAAAEIRERLPAVAEEVGVTLQFRTGVNTGPVLMGEGENLAIGDAVNVAARLEQAAAPGEILLGTETWQLVRDAVEVEPLEPLELKGKSEPVPAYRLLRLDPGAPGVARHFDVPLVGRAEELELLQQAWHRAVQQPGCHLFTLLGEAGVGKSRLVSELLSAVGDEAAVLRGRCLPYGEGITFWPLVEALMPVGDLAQPVIERMSSGGAATPEELFWDVRRLLEALAAEEPVILHIDDLQWAEPMLMDLLDHVVDLSRGAPILVLCTARPDLLEDRPAWGGGKLNASTVLLEPLDPGDAEALLHELGDGLDPEARSRVIAASEGNPLFLEEMVGLARERGSVEVPATIQALLAARLERLASDERELLERGAVEGEVFHRLAVKALADERLSAEVELRLAGLVRKELIRPHPATFSGDEAFRFRHLLIRDAAYDGLPKATRAELHERFAGWLEENAQNLPELDEIAGWHLEQAVRYRQELGREADPQLGASAAIHLLAAGEQAGRRGDELAGRKLLQRALELVPPAAALRPRIALALAEQLTTSEDLDRVDGLLTEAEDDAGTAGPAELVRLEWMLRARPREAMQALRSRLPRLLEELAAAGDERGLAKAHMCAYEAHWMASQAVPAAAEARLAAEHAAACGDEGLRARALGALIGPLGLGPYSADEFADELPRIASQSSSPYLAGLVDLARCVLERFQGKLDSAAESAQRAIAGFEALGIAVVAGGCSMELSEVKFAGHDPGAALAVLRRGDAILERLGERGFRSTTQARLAEAYELLGDRASARAAIELSDELCAPEDVINYAITHRVRARLALADGDAAGAERWARSAVRYAFETDFAEYRAKAKLELAGVLSELGRRDEAEGVAHEALAISEAKGDRPAIAEAQAALERL